MLRGVDSVSYELDLPKGTTEGQIEISGHQTSIAIRIRVSDSLVLRCALPVFAEMRGKARMDLRGDVLTLSFDNAER